MTKDERINICRTCKNHIIDDRYGVLCGLTRNIPNFQTTCKDFTKPMLSTPQLKIDKRIIHRKRKPKNGFKSLLGTGISIWLLFKLVMLILKFLRD